MKEVSTMKINNNSSSFPNCTFLGGTCASSTRRDLIPLLNDSVPYFDPQLEPGEWNDAAAAAEDECKAQCKLFVFVLTPDSLSAYSGFEIGILAATKSRKLIFAAVGDFPADQIKGIQKIARDVAKLGGSVCSTLEDVANAVNNCYWLT